MTKEEVIVPLNSYYFRIKECTRELSKSNPSNSMFKLIVEMLDEPEMVVDGEPVNINGLEPKPVYISPIAEDGIVTPKALKRLNDFRQACDMDPVGSKEEASLVEATHFIGRKFEALASTKEDVMKDRATGRVITNKAGEPLKTSSFEVGRMEIPKHRR